MRRLLLCLFILGCFLIGGPEIATAEKWAVAAEAASQRIEVDEDSIALVLGNSRAVCQAKFISKGITAVSKIYVDFPSKSFACVDIMMIDAAGNQVAASQVIRKSLSRFKRTLSGKAYITSFRHIGM